MALTFCAIDFCCAIYRRTREFRGDWPRFCAEIVVEVVVFRSHAPIKILAVVVFKKIKKNRHLIAFVTGVNQSSSV